MSSYDELRKKNLEIGPFVKWHFNKILKNIKRSLKIKQSFRNPFQFKLKEPIPFYLFSHIYHAIKTCQEETTPPSILFSTITDKPGRKATYTKSFTLKLLNFYSVLHLFTHLNSKRNVLNSLKKKVKNSDIRVVVTGEKPFVFFITGKRRCYLSPVILRF